MKTAYRIYICVGILLLFESFRETNSASLTRKVSTSVDKEGFQSLNDVACNDPEGVSDFGHWLPRRRRELKNSSPIFVGETAEKPDQTTEKDYSSTSPSTLTVPGPVQEIVSRQDVIGLNRGVDTHHQQPLPSTVSSVSKLVGQYQTSGQSFKSRATACVHCGWRGDHAPNCPFK